MIHILLLFIFLNPIQKVRAADRVYTDISIEEDTYIEQGYPDISPWNNRNLYLGYDWWYSKQKTRVLIKPNSNELSNLNIRPEDITDAYVVVNTYNYEGTASNSTLKSAPIQSFWSMYSVTWNNQPTRGSTNDITSITNTSGQKFIDVTASIKEILSNSSKNGIMLTLQEESNDALLLWATGCSVAPTLPQCASESEAPIIRIFYETNNIPSQCSLSKPALNIVQNSTEVALLASESIDPEGDDIFYVGKICTTEDCQEIVWKDSIYTDQDSVIELEEGRYYASCNATDYHTSNNWGISKEINIDLTSPNSPEIIEKPPYSSSYDSNIYWLQDEVGLEYRVISSERNTFSAYNTYSEWLTAPPAIFTHIKEKTYYYKVQARDNAGNISEWSEVTSTTIDLSLPKIKYFKTSKEIISPNTLKDGEVDESAYIQGGIEETNLAKIKLSILDKKGDIVFSIVETEKTYIRTHWPDKLGYSDGKYYAVLQGIDQLGNSIQSDPIILTLDTSPPQKAKYSGIRNYGKYNKLPIKINITCPINSTSKIKLGNKILNEGTQKYSFKLDTTDGEKTLSTRCTDIAGNYSDNKIKFTIDTKPPTKPSLTLSYSEKNKQVIASVYCREDGAARFFINGVSKGSIKCNAKKYAKFVLISKPKLPSLITAQARTSDMVGNWSEIAERKFYIKDNSKYTKNLSLEVSCLAIHNISTNKTTKFSCTWPAGNLLTYRGTDKSKDKYSSLFNVSKIKRTKVYLTLMKCKQKTLFDFRTWFGCFEEKIESKEISGVTIPLFSSKEALYNQNLEEIEVVHSNVEQIQISQKYISTFYTNYGGIKISNTIVSKEKESSFKIDLPKTESKSYFSWIFQKYEGVSQWHGYTRYQSPHKGIDFSVYKKEILSPADGKVVAARYDKTSPCFAGGYYVALKHSNGLFTYYFHLKSIEGIKVGDAVKKGSKIGISGNSGRYNCQALAYHLHFEARTSREPKDHINPIPYFNINWNNILTAKADLFPGRLSGDNPHPKF